MPEPDNGTVETSTNEQDPIAAVLATVPPAAAMYLRDQLRGLAAEAGSARAEAAEVRRQLGADIERLRLYAAGLAARVAELERGGSASRADQLIARLAAAARRGAR